MKNLKLSLIIITLILSLFTTKISAQDNSDFTIGEIITIGKDGYYLIDPNAHIDESINPGEEYFGHDVFTGLPVGVGIESEGLEANALWEVVSYTNAYNNTGSKALRNVATGNYLGFYVEFHPSQLTDVRVYGNLNHGQINTTAANGVTINFEFAPYELSKTTIYNGGTITIWTLFNCRQWKDFTLEYKDDKWVVIDATSWATSYNAVSNSVGTTPPTVFSDTQYTSTTYEISGIQSSYPVAGGGGIFDLKADAFVSKINGTYYLSDKGTKVYINKEVDSLNINSVTLAATSTSIANQEITNSQVKFPANTTNNSRNSIINATYTFTDGANTKTITENIEFVQVPQIPVSNLNFTHKNGNIQQVHTDTRIIYAIPNQKRHLALPLEGNPNYKKGFYRWYNYKTDTTVNALLFGNDHWEKFANGKGSFLYYGDDLNNNTPDGTYYMFTGNPIKVAVDISQYIDYTISGNTFTEPTLSNRVIYDIRNASEIADKLDNTTNQLPLEHNTLYAPAGETIYIGPTYKWTGADCNYFINKSGSEYPVSINGNAVWTKDGVEFTPSSIHDSRLIPITAPASLTEPNEYVLYADKAKTKVIAHFHVYASPKDKIGPVLEQGGKALFTHAELDEKYKLVGVTDFNSNKDNTPLDLNQSTYGFYKTGISRANGSGGIVDGEYALFNSYEGISNHGNGSGKFVYVKTNSYPGKIADLQIEEGQNLCPGAPIFISAWVANMGKNDPHASLRFEIIGVNNDGRKTNLMTFITGEIPTGGWHQVIFQLQITQLYYDEYHLHVANNGHNQSDDFAIDDIRMYTTKPLLSGVSGLSACDMDKEKNVAVLRVDYCQLTNLYGNDSLYYQWHNGKADNIGSVLDLNYINERKGAQLQPCGAIEIISAFIPSGNSEPNFTKENIEAKNKRYYPSIEAFLYSNDASEEAVHEIYTVEDGHIILYIVHSSALFQEGNYYTAQIMQRVPDFSHNVSCGAYYTYEVRPRTALTVDGIVYDEAVLKNLSINGEHTLGIQVYGFDSNGDIAKSTANADWFKLSENMLGDEVISALRNFRYEYPTATSLQPIKGIFETRDYNLLNSLIVGNLLKLNLANITITINEEVSNYIAIPVIATSFSPEFMACDNPLYITLGAEVTMSYAKSDGNGGYIPYENLPKELKGSPIIVRVPYSQIESKLNSLTFTIDYLGEGFTSLKSKDVVLCTADHNGPVIYKITTNVSRLRINAPITLQKENNEFKFEAGHTYVFHCAGYEDDTKVNPGTFIVHIIPDVVIWKPRHAGLSTAWHNDDNWASIESYNNPYATTRGFIPTSETNVIIPALTDTRYAPILSQATALEEGSNEHLEYEYGIEFNSCKNIYFDENAALANHHMLKYQNAYIDMHFDHNDGTFELKSVPLNDVYSGDFYIPKVGDKATTGDVETFNFGTPAAVNTRVANKFRQKTFNASVTQYAGTEQNVVKCETSTWSEPTNALNMPWQVGRGYAIAKQTTTNQDYVRLPKTATEYCFYYDNNGQEGEIPFNKTTIARSANAKKLAFENNVLQGGNYIISLNNDTPSDIFLVGNPFMCDLSINQLYETNLDLNDEFYYQYIDNVLEVQFVSKNDINYIKPMDAIFVKRWEASNNLTLYFNAGMMYYRDFKPEDLVQIQAPIRRAKELKEILTITAHRNDRISKTTIELSSNATTQFTTEEDVPTLLLDPELTPFAIYSIADNQAIAYNKVDDIYMIPLSINVIDGEEMGDITFEFSGVDNLSQYVYLYDSYEDRYISLAEGDVFNYDVEVNQEVRYYITSRRAGDVTTELDESMIETVKVLNLGEGQMMIYASENINSLNVYDLTGKLIVSETNINAPQHNITLPQHNVYMFEIITESTVSNQKVVIK